MDARRCVLRPAAWAPLPAGLVVMRHILCQDEAAKRPDFMYIVDLLNRYSRLHAEAIFGRHATLDKCIGGAIMAFRGATMDQPDHTCHVQRRFNLTAWSRPRASTARYIGTNPHGS